MSPGEKKRRLRRRAETEAAANEKLALLRADGANCGNCKHIGKAPHDEKLCCDLGSDFHGHQITSRENLCTQWASTPTSAGGRDG